MAWFKRKEGNGSSDGEGGGGLNIQPEKARAWFNQARTAADTRNYPYAIQCYLNGIKFDPTNLEAHKSLWEIASLHVKTGGKPATGKEIREMRGDNRPVDRLAAAELAWMTDVLNSNLNLKFLNEAAGLGLSDVALHFGGIGINVLGRSTKKPSKNAFVQYVDLFEEIGAYEMAVKVGEVALSLDRTDAALQARIRNLSAQATMDKGRYDTNVGQEGSYRGSIRDAEAQKLLTEEDNYAAGTDQMLRRIQTARAEWQANPLDPNAIQRYAEAMGKSGDEKLETEAIAVFRKGYEDTSEYRFRMQAGDIKLMQARRKLRALKEKAEETGDPVDQARVEKGEREILTAEVGEYRERCEKYPTDLGLRFELGRRLYELGEYDEAIPSLQEAQNDARHRSKAQHLIGLCFLKHEWFDEAVESLRTAVDNYEFKDDDAHLAMRYDLMSALQAHARENDDLAAAEEAGEHAKTIALKQLSFRDIRSKRDEIRQLIKDIKAKQ
ncbi:MAG: hypothetical protein IT430_16845 [Phycisphaerales bacterium]|nr:hypothetical protein [Phycisphaerales bacterium]